MPRKARSVTNIRSEARKHTETALNTLTAIASQPKAPAAARVAAATALLDRGWGKAAQPLTGEDGKGPAVIEVIRRIVDGAEDHDRPANGEDLHTTH